MGILFFKKNIIIINPKIKTLRLRSNLVTDCCLTLRFGSPLLRQGCFISFPVASELYIWTISVRASDRRSDQNFSCAKFENETALGRWGDGEKSPNPQSDEFLSCSVISFPVASELLAKIRTRHCPLVST
jgi:hypothetical protein